MDNIALAGWNHVADRQIKREGTAAMRDSTHLSYTRMVLLLLCFVSAGMQNRLLAGTGKLDIGWMTTPIYDVRGDAIIRHNGDRFSNRPLYCNQLPAIVLAGDRPLVRFGQGGILNGTFIAALARGNNAKWLHDFSDVTSSYRADRMQWQLKDAAYGGTTLTLVAVPTGQGDGMALHLKIANPQPGDRLIWAFGGGHGLKGGIQADYDLTTDAWTQVGQGARAKIMTIGFVPDQTEGNQVKLADGGCTLQAGGGKGSTGIAGVVCSDVGEMSIADADQWADPLALARSTGSAHPMVCGVIDLTRTSEIFWGMLATPKQEAGDLSHMATAQQMFDAGMKRAESIQNTIVIDTPDPQFNAEVEASTAVVDGVFREGMFTHSGMRWGVPLLGWRTMVGGTVYGWHDRVKTQAVACIKRQITESDKTVPHANPLTGLSSQASDSRLFGKGRIEFHQPEHYDMQTQFFDQLIHAWRWTGDAELEKALRPALKLHLQYIKECFDPNDTGLYESYANTWPTDDQWYDGGGTAEETAYAYNAQCAALEMARRAGDESAVKTHEAEIKKIHDAFMSKLWSTKSEHVGSWVEQGGHERLHEDCWLYAIFCPIDAGLLDTDRAAQSLYYTEWGLERENMPYGGQRCWTANWVPSKWSLREMWPGDVYQLALAYMQNGQADEGWKLMRGTYPAMAFFGPVPGDLGHPNGGTDFNDCASQFCRAVVEGMFGYHPNYPDGVVTIVPQLPGDWDHASIKTPDFSLAMRGNSYQVKLTQPAKLDLRLPVRAGKLDAVTVNGQPSKYELLPGFGCTIVKLDIPKCDAADIAIRCEQPLPNNPPLMVQAKVGEKIDLPADGAQMVQPPVLPTTAGNHLVSEVVKIGDMPQRRVFKISMEDPAAKAAQADACIAKVPDAAKWEQLDLSKTFNADVRTIFKQQYLSSRPNTCSLRLAVDGYSTWQEMLGPNGRAGTSAAPAVELSHVKDLLKDSTLQTTQGVPFAWPGKEKNIAFTSMWDNWPRTVSVPVNRKADGIWLLVCGFTNPMQCRISNAEFRFTYTDGTVDKLELVPPLNFWSMCPFGGADYSYQRDGFALPQTPPALVNLGDNCRAILLNRKLRPGATLRDVTLETFSQEVTIGVMGITLMNPN
jgi:hypothetical protein